MKKILLLTNKASAMGGIWFVNKTLGEEFLKRGYDVNYLAIRDNDEHDKLIASFKTNIVNYSDSWGITHKRDVLKKMFKKDFFKTCKQYFIDRRKLNDDYKKMKGIIAEMKPDYIIAAHYQVLLGIPQDYLGRTCFVQHSSFEYMLRDKNNIKILKRLNNELFGLYWLCKSTMNKAEKFGFQKNHYIYNPNKFTTDKISDVANNKKIVVITRIDNNKRIDLMIDIVDRCFQKFNCTDWVFEIYGAGEFNKHSKDVFSKNKNIVYKGITKNPLEVLLQSSIILNTSLSEGFSLSIIEGYSCGLPVVSFNFGETVYEQIIDGKTGYVVENNDVDLFVDKLGKLITCPLELKQLSQNAKDFSRQFDCSVVVNEWEKVFNLLNDKYNSK